MTEVIRAVLLTIEYSAEEGDMELSGFTNFDYTYAQAPTPLSSAATPNRRTYCCVLDYTLEVPFGRPISIPFFEAQPF